MFHKQDYHPPEKMWVDLWVGVRGNAVKDLA